MTRKVIVRAVLGIAGAAFLFINSPKTQAAEAIGMDTGIAGISEIMDSYYEARFNYDPDLSPSDINTDMSVGGIRLKAINRVPSPYSNLAIANVQDFVNIRSGPSTDTEKVGKLTRGCVANVLAIEGDWVKIDSGKVKGGYINKEYLLIGEEAEALMEKVCTKYAQVNTTTLNVRAGQGIDQKIVTQIPLGEKYIIREEYDEWAKIVLGISDEDGEERYGYVWKDYIKISYDFDYAISKEEEEAKLAQEAASRQAEQERLAKLAAQQAANKTSNKQASGSNTSGSSNSNSSNKQNSGASTASNKAEKPSTSATGLALGKEIAEYAQKFVGNPYKWGGTSLTNGADCSGFVSAVYKQFGYTIPRVSRDQSRSAGVAEVTPNLANLQPGDLIFYSSGGRVDHVAMYIGNGKVVHASNYKEGIKISVWNYRTPHNARRILQ